MDNDESWRSLMPVPLHVDVYAAVLTRPTLASALLAIPLGIPLYFLFPLLVKLLPGGITTAMWYSQPFWFRAFLVWVANVITLQLYIRRPY